MRFERVASRAKGIVTRRELLAAGVTSAQIKQRLEIGYPFPEYGGVYRVRHRAPKFESSYMAAVRACGVGELLSRMAAA